MLDQEKWHEHLPSDWATSAALHPAMTTLLNSTTLPLWDAFPPISKEWAVIQESWFTMIFATQKLDDFLNTSYTTEDQIKSALKFMPKVTLDEKLEQANSSLIKECQRNINLPIDLTASIKHAAKRNASKLDAYKAKVQSITDNQHSQGITLHHNSQTLAQTEEHIRMFTSSNHVTFPQWRKDSVAILRSGGTMKEFWHTTILKKVGAPAKHKISQEAITDKSVDKIMCDLALHFNRSDRVVALLTRLHVQASPKPNPKLEPYSSYKTLTTHCKILTGVSEFIKHSDDPDKYTFL